MKYLLLPLAILCLAGPGLAQLKTKETCPAITIDILDGRVNELNPRSTNGEIKGKLPCFSSSEDENETAACGGNVFYKDRDIYFHTGSDYVEIGPKFKGKISLPLMGAARNSLFKWLGLPKLKDRNWEAYQTAYGTLVLYFNTGNKVNKIQFSTEPSERLKLCE